MTKPPSNQQTTTETARSKDEKKLSEDLRWFSDPAFIAQQRTASEKAWSRMGRATWSQMEWFVKLTNTAGFESMSAGEQLTWQEEFVAMWGERYMGFLETPPDTKRYPRPPSTPHQMRESAIPPPTPAQMQEVRDVIASHIDELADDKGTRIGGLNISYTVAFYKNPAYDQNKELDRYLIHRGETADPVSNIYRQNLLLRVSKLLDAEKYADKVRRCEHCKKVFLQLKRTAKYCSSKCYTVAGMRRLRAERKTQTALKMKNKKQAHRATRKGESRHGKKRR